MEGPIDDPIPVLPAGPIEGRGGRRSWWQRWTEPEAEVTAAWCPECSAEYRAGVALCSTCAVPLEAGPMPEPEPEREPAAEGSDRHDVVEYDLSDWSDAQRAELQEQLGLSEVPFEWTGTDLAVPGAHEDAVDDLIDVIDEADDLSFPGRIGAEVEYELPEWLPEQRDTLVAQLQEAGIPFGWDGVNLGVREVDEATVDAIVASIDPDFPLG